MGARKKDFKNLLSSRLLSAGATYDEKRDKFTLDTKVGIAEIRVDGDTKFLFSMFVLFLEVERAREVVNCNPHSGKYNTHISVKNANVEDAVEDCLDSLLLVCH